MQTPHVVIVGGGFGGLTAAKSLRGANVKVTLIDRTNHHLFQPLLYQVASAGLSPADIASPIRSILSSQTNAQVLMGEVTAIDLAGRRVVLADGEISYDYVILAAGMHTNYFGHDEWEPFAPGLKSIDDAIEIRRRVLSAFERAERETDDARRRALLTFVVTGGGATGVEMAGALSELSRFVLNRDFRAIRPEETRVLLIEAGPRLLTSFPEDVSAKGKRALEELGVEVRLGAKVTTIDETGVSLKNEKGGDEHIPSSVVVWGAGVTISPLAKSLGVPLDKQGRVMVEPDVSIPGHPEAFVIGDMARLDQDGKPLPGLSPVAMQEARAVAKSIRATIASRPRKPFHYWDKGNMATIGRSRAVAVVKNIHLSGFIAWLAWLFVHIWYLIGFRNRFIVMFEWFWSYITYKRGSRLITGQRWSQSAKGNEQRTQHEGTKARRAPQREVAEKIN